MNLNAIIDEVCVKYQVSKNDIFSHRRGKDSVLARKILYKVLSLDGKSSTQIGNILHRDHSTVVVSLQQMDKEMLEYSTYLYLKHREDELISNLVDKETVLKIIMDKIKKLYNRGLKENEIAKELDLTPKRVDIMIKIIKDSCDTKLVPDYKNGTYRTIYL